jgi:hypothetical protein
LRLFRNAHRYFALLLCVCALAFAPTYALVFRTAPWVLHFHNLAMLGWLAMLVVQAWAIRARRLAWHRAIGRISYVLVPAAVISGAIVTQQFLRKGDDGVTELEMTAAVLPILALPVFTAAYLLALRHRHRPALHARWMTAASLVITGAAFLRFFLVLFGLDLRMGAHAAYLLIELILVVLIANDWRQRYRATPFFPFLIVHLQQHVILEFSSDWTWWRILVNALHG